MKTKFTEKQLFEAYQNQKTPELGSAFVAKVMQTIDEDLSWQPIFKFAAFNVFLAGVCAIFAVYLMDINDLSLQLVIDSGIII